MRMARARVATHSLTITHDTLDLVTSLVDKSLLQRTSAQAESRFGMLKTIREFALEQLAASGETEQIAALAVVVLWRDGSMNDLGRPSLANPLSERRAGNEPVVRS